MRKLSLLISGLILCAGLTSCKQHANGGDPFPRNGGSTRHAPVPLPLLPDEENPDLPDAPDDSTPVPPDIWDVSDTDVSKISKDRKLIAFTFDDAPTRYLENLIAVYADYNENNPDCVASATLFLNGYLFDNQNTPLLTAALGLGFELGNHTYSHADLTTLSTEEAVAEIERVDELLFHIDGKMRHLFRPPYGKIANEQKSTVNAPIINWTIDTLDWTGVDEERVYQTVMQNKFSGAIVLMHDGCENTLHALKRLLPDLKAEGYQVVSVSQLSKMHGCNLYNGKEYIRARKR